MSENPDHNQQRQLSFNEISGSPSSSPHTSFRSIKGAESNGTNLKLLATALPRCSSSTIDTLGAELMSTGLKLVPFGAESFYRFC